MPRGECRDPAARWAPFVPITNTDQIGTVVDEWRDLDIELAVLDEAVNTPRQPLLDTNLPAGRAVVYFTFLSGGPAPYAQVADARWPVCVGSARDGRERVGRHRINCRSIPNLGRGELVWICAVETASEAAARYVEALCIARLRPIWNQPCMAGFGSKDQGSRRRTQAPPPFALVHPGRIVGTGDPTVSTGMLRRRIVEHLAKTAMPLWPAIP